MKLRGQYFLAFVLIPCIMWALNGWPTGLLLRFVGIPWACEGIMDPRMFFGIRRVLSLQAATLLFVVAFIVMARRQRIATWKAVVLIAVTSNLLAGVIAAFYPDLSVWRLKWYFDKEKTGTEYADGFTRRRFLQIRNGMSRSEVVQLIGKGLPKMRVVEVPESVGTWFYSREKSGCDNYWQYRVYFREDNNDTVDYIWMSFWWD